MAYIGEILLSVATELNMKGLILRAEVRQRQKTKGSHLYVYFLKFIKFLNSE